MMGQEFDCQNCKRPGCLKKEQYLKLNNLPSCPLKDKIVFLNKKNIWNYIDIIKNMIQGQKTLISIVNAFIGVCPKSILNEDIYEILNRYFYCKDFGIQPFGGSYDDQPTEWLYFSNIIQDELRKVQSQTKPK